MHQMQAVTRHCISQNLRFYHYDHDSNVDHVTSYDQFCDMIDFWKVMLVEKHAAAAGQKVLIDIAHLSIYYYTVLFAVAELGMQLVVDMPKAWNKDFDKDYKINLHGKIDLIITEGSKIHDVNQQYDVAKQRYLSNNICVTEDYNTYTIKDHTLYESIAKKIFCHEDDIFVLSYTSGTTGPPKKIKDSHKKIFNMAARIGQYLMFEPHHSVVHTAGLHHGSSFCIFMLPSFMICNEHHTHTATGVASLPSLQQFVVRHKINHLYLYTNNFCEPFLQMMPRVDHELHVLKLYAITPADVAQMKHKNITTISSMFGDMAIGHGMFIKTVRQDQDPDTYDPMDFGPPRDDFYQFRIDDAQSLWTRLPLIDNEWRTSNDKFVLIDGCYKFLGRGLFSRINGVWIKLSDVDFQIRRLFPADSATIVFDTDFERLYLVIWKQNDDSETKFLSWLADNYQGLKPDLIVRDQIYEHFFVARKADPERVRRHCRQKIRDASMVSEQ